MPQQRRRRRVHPAAAAAAPERRASLRRQERQPRGAARGRDPGAAGLRDLDRGVRSVPAQTRASRAGSPRPWRASRRRRRRDRQRVPCDQRGDALRAGAGRRARRGRAAATPRSATPPASDSPPVAVRSSALGEDSEDATFAGQQETYLWVRGVEHVCDAVRDCWASLYSPPAISYRVRLGRSPRARRRWGSPCS